MNVFLLFFAVKVALCSINSVVVGLNELVGTLKTSITSGNDVKPCISAINQISNEILRDLALLSDNFLRGYVSFKEEAVILLCENLTTDFGSIEVHQFYQFLIHDINFLDALFSIDRIPQVIHFIIKAASKHDAKEATQVINILNRKLDSEGLQKLNKLIEYVRHEKPTHVKAIENQIIENTHDPEAIYDILTELRRTGTLLSVDGYTNLVKCFLCFDFKLHPEWFYPTLEALKDIFILHKSNADLQMAVGDFILSEKVLLSLSTDRVIDSYCVILAVLSRVNAIPPATIDSMSPEMINHFHLYIGFAKDITKIFNCLHILLALNNESNEANFRMAISAINNLKKMQGSDPILKQVITIDYDIIKSTPKTFFRIYTDESNPLYSISMKTICLLGLLTYDLSEDQERKQSCLSIVAGIGSLLLLYDKDSKNYPTDLINEILPNMDDIIESTLYSIKNSKVSMDFDRLAGIIKLIQLHPSQESKNSYTDRFCCQFISNISLQFNRYVFVSAFQITDKRNVYITAFLSFLHEYLKGNSTHSLYLREFYAFLKGSRLVYKTESIIIERILNR